MSTSTMTAERDGMLAPMRVLRPVRVGGVDRAHGEVVETIEAIRRNVDILIERRYFSPDVHTEQTVSCPCGRRWIDESHANLCPSCSSFDTPDEAESEES